MKKTLLCALLAALCLCAASAGAQEAEDITRRCRLTLSDGRDAGKRLTDRNYATHWQSADDGGAVTAEARGDAMIASVYVCFGETPSSWSLEALRGDEWQTEYRCASGFQHVYTALEEPAAAVRLTAGEGQLMDVEELFLFGEGERPAAAQVWQPPVEKAELLFLSTHADDELLFFAGGIPTYAAERQRAVVVAYLVDCGAQRRSELLNGLWSMGVRNYPVIGPFPDKYKKTVAEAYEIMGGEEAVQAWVTSLFRTYRPEVVVTHDINGEYGHCQHRVAAECALKAFELAAAPAQSGAWQVKKLYLHLWKENRIRMDWSQPLLSQEGRTGMQAAARAYRLHVSQQSTGMSVSGTGRQYDNTLFGLARTTVGPDEAGGDFLEHIPAENAVR